MKKFLVVALSALLLLAMFIPAMAEDAPKFTTTVSANRVKRGETVTVNVSVDKAFDAKALAVDYADLCNPAAFELVDCAWTAGVLAKLPVGTTDPAKFKAAAFNLVPATGITGDIFTLTVKAKNDATFNSYDFKVVVLVDSVEATAIGTTVEIYHDCQFDTQYSKDTDGHWYACTVDGCTVAPAKSGHGWANDCDTTCDTCGHTRTVTHDYSVQNKDTTNHWMECSVCHVVDESTKAAHTPKANDIQVSPADCANPAIYKKECSVCNAQIGATFPVGSPDASLHSGGTATCKDKAVCQHCSQPYGTVDANNHVGETKVENNDTEHWTVCKSCSTEIAGTRTAHTGGTATCKDKAVCSCGQSYGTVNATNHVGETEVENNDTEHWTVCKSCSTEIAGTRTAHTGGTATCKDKAVCSCGQAYGELDLTTHIGGKADCKNKAVCDRCGESYGEINPQVHTGNVNVVPEEPATCKKEGKTEEISCKDCGAVLTPSTPLDKEAHVITEWTETKPASETEEGEKKGKCDVCGDEFTVKTDKLVSAIKPENIVNGNGESVDGAKVEGVGETKLPENTAVGVVPVAPEQLEDAAEEMKPEIDKIPEAAGKDLIGATVVVIYSNDEYIDDATGDEILDGSANEKLPGKVKVTVPVNGDLSKYEKLIVLAVNEDGKVSKIEATVENGTVAFETESPMNVVMVLGSKIADPNVPQNGDSSEVVLFASLALVSVLTLGAMFVSKKEKASK